jgi:hypothetical protein
VSFEQDMHTIMDVLVDAGFANVATSAVLSTEYGELSFFGDEAGRLLQIIRYGLATEAVK